MIAVSIVSYNTSSLLKKTLENLYSQKLTQDLEIWVVDNNSSDDSVEMIRKNFPKINLIVSKENLGFAKGQNLALKKIKSPLTLILNPDTQFPENTLSKMLDFADKNQELGIISSKVISSDGSLSSNGGDLPIGLPLLSWLFNFDSLIATSFHRSDKKFYESRDVGWLGGTFMWVRKKVFDNIGYFNEDYFMYFEDVEFCFRAKNAGFKIGFNPEVEIVHLSGASSDNPRLTQWQGEMRGLLRFYRQNFGIAYAGLVGLLLRIALLLRIIAFATLGKLNYSSIYIKVLAGL